MYQQLFQALPEIANFIGDALARAIRGESLSDACQRVFKFPLEGELTRQNIADMQMHVGMWSKRYQEALRLSMSLSSCSESVRDYVVRDIEESLEKAEFMLESQLQLAEKVFKAYLPQEAAAQMARLQHIAWPERPIQIKAALAKAS